MKFKVLYEEFARNWLAITDPVEREIMKKYANFSKIMGIFYTGKYYDNQMTSFKSKHHDMTNQLNIILHPAYLFGTISGFIILPSVPIVLDVIYPLNESRSRYLLVRGEFPIDPNEHYMIIYFYLALCAIASFHVVVGVDPMFMSVIYHFVGLVSVVK